MSARGRYEVKLARASVEVYDLAEGEVVLFWDCTPRQRRRMGEALIRDLDRMTAAEFLDRWIVAEPEHFD